MRSDILIRMRAILECLVSDDSRGISLTFGGGDDILADGVLDAVLDLKNPLKDSAGCSAAADGAIFPILETRS